MGVRMKPADLTSRGRKPRVAAASTGRMRAPKAPIGLSDTALVQWREFWRSPVANRVMWPGDRQLVERWIRLVDRVAELEAALGTNTTAEGYRGEPKRSPEFMAWRQTVEMLERCEEKLGLSPQSRFRLGIPLQDARKSARLKQYRGRAAAPEQFPVPAGWTVVGESDPRDQLRERDHA